MRGGEDRRGDVVDLLKAILFQHFDQAPLGEPQRARLRLDIAEHLHGRAHVGLDDLNQQRVELALLGKLHHREPDPLLEQLAGVG